MVSLRRRLTYDVAVRLSPLIPLSEQHRICAIFLLLLESQPPQGDDRCLRDQQGDRPACPAVRCGLIIEVLFQEIFEIQRKVCTFVSTYKVNPLKEIGTSAPTEVLFSYLNGGMEPEM